MNFRARTLDRTVLKDVWTKSAYNKEGFEIRQDDTILDIGGHIGAFTVFAATKSTKGKVYTFEPFKDNYEGFLVDSLLYKEVSYRLRRSLSFLFRRRRPCPEDRRHAAAEPCGPI